MFDPPVSIIGIDQGMTATGLAVVGYDGKGFSLPHHCKGCLDSKSGRAIIRRGFEIGMSAGCRGFAMEKGWHGAKAGRSALAGSRVTRGQGKAEGMILMIADDFGLLRLPDVPVSTAKAVLAGSGRASKEMMIRAAMLRFGLLGDPLSEHEADAAGIASAALRRMIREEMIAAAGRR